MSKVFFVAVCGGLAALGCSGGADDHRPRGEDVVPLEPSPDRDQWEADHPELATPTGESDKACFARSDFLHLVNVATGTWGNWAPCIDFCPENSFVYKVNLKSLGPQGSGVDDVAVNGISFHCWDRSFGVFTDFVESSQGPWGSWLGDAQCPTFNASNPFEGANALVEAPQGGGDDTALNSVAYSCKVFPNQQWGVPSNMSYGNWNGLRRCPTGSQVCGIKTRVLPQQGSGIDDSALNGFDIACCSWPGDF
jgi:hypothetical protein